MVQGLKSKAAAGAITALMVLLPTDEGGVSKGFSKPYIDIAGVKTVCYGHTGKDIENRIYSQAECNDFLKKDITRHMKRVESCANKEIPERMLVAFTSFDFNTGGWCGSRSNREFNAGNFKEACRAMAYSPSGKPAWSYRNGTVFVPGLFSRRIRESGVCYEGAS